MYNKFLAFSLNILGHASQILNFDYPFELFFAENMEDNNDNFQKILNFVY